MDCDAGIQVRLQSMLLLGSASSALVVARAPLRACITHDSSVPQVRLQPRLQQFLAPWPGSPAAYDPFDHCMLGACCAALQFLEELLGLGISAAPFPITAAYLYTRRPFPPCKIL